MKPFSSAIFKTLILVLAVIAQVHFAYAQTQAGIIPNGKATFLDANGNPLSSGKVFFYVPSTTTPKTTYKDINQTIPNTNPVTLDAAGRALIWGTGNYRQIVQDQNNNVIWDVTTTVSGTGATGPTATGDGDLVGTIKPWAGTTAPNQYMFAYGQQLSRATYSSLYTAITSTQSIFCNSGSAVLTGLSDTTNFWIGMTVEVACVPSGVTTVINKTASSVTLAVNANATQNVNATFFPWGNGNGSTTFSLPDFRGLVPVGNNIMGGTASLNINSTYFGSTNPNSIGAQGGNQSYTLLAANLPPHTHTSPTLTDPGHTHGNVLTNPIGNTQGGGSGFFAGLVSNTASNTTGITLSASTGTNASGTSTAFSIVQPSKTVNYIIKVTPDANSATANGVTDINGMTGSIGCGTNVTCTGNVISVNIRNTFPQLISPTTTVADALTPTDALTISTGSTSLTDGTARFISTDVGKTISIPGVGPYVAYATAVNAGAGYTNGVQTLTVSGGTCSVAPQISTLIIANVVSTIVGIINKGNCTVQPSNPVSFTGGGGAGATMNLTWSPLSTTIAGFTNANTITLGTSPSKSLAAVSTTFVYGTDDRSALQTAINSLLTLAVNGTATLQLCGSYLVNLNSSITLNAGNSNNSPNMSIVGICPNTRLLFTGDGSSWGIFAGGSGASTATTTIAANASQGAGTLQLTSAVGFNIGDYIQISNNTALGGFTKGEINKVSSISGNILTLTSALSFDTDIGQTNSVMNRALQERETINGLMFDCTFTQGQINAAVFEYTAQSVYDVQTKGCNTVNSNGLGLFGVYNANVNLMDVGSGNLGATDASTLAFIGSSFVKMNISDAKGFGIDINQANRNKFDIILNKTLGRGIKFTSSANNFGDLSSTDTPLGNAGFNAVAFDGASSYNHFGTVIAVGAGGISGGQGNCIWSSGSGGGNIGNTIDRAILANCPVPIAIGAADTGSILSAEYGAGAVAANNIIAGTFPIIAVGGALTPTTIAINGCGLAGGQFCVNGISTFNEHVTVASNSSQGFTVQQGTSGNIGFNVDTSTITAGNGIEIKLNNAGAGTNIRVVSTTTNEALTINAKGTGTITLGDVSTGSIIHTRATTLSAALTYGGVTLNNAVTGTGNMVLSTSPSLVTPSLGVATATSLAINGCTISTNVLCSTGQEFFNGSNENNNVYTDGFGAARNVSLGIQRIVTNFTGAPLGLGIDLQWNNSVAAQSTNALILAITTPVGNATAHNTLRAMQVNAAHLGTNTVTLMGGANFTAGNSGTGTVTSAIGFLSSITNNGAGTQGTSTGVQINTPIGTGSGTSTWTNISGIEILDQKPSGAGTNTLTNPPVAFLIDSQTASGAFAIKQSGSGINQFDSAILALASTAIPAGGTAGVGYKFSTTSNFGIFFGSGAPSLAAAKGSIYLRSDGAINARMYINTDGSTTWTAFNTTS